MKKLAVGSPWIVGLVGAAHLALVVGILQGCGTPRPMPAEPPPAPVMPPPVVPEPTAPLPPPLLVPPAAGVPVPPPVAPPARDLAPKEHTVQPGESLSKIAARYGLSTRELAELNGIKDPNKVRAGQKLVLPGYAATKPAPKPAVPRPVAAGDGEYVVQPGDSLSRIAARLGVKTHDLAMLNGITDPNTIRAGQKLAVPKGAAKPSQPPPAPAEPLPMEAAPAPAAPPPVAEPVIPTPPPMPLPPPAAAAPTTPAPLPPVSPIVSATPAPLSPPAVSLGASARKPVRYPVSQGEKLEEIAKTFMVTPESILKLNNLKDASEVRAGMMLSIPVEP